MKLIKSINTNKDCILAAIAKARGISASEAIAHGFDTSDLAVRGYGIFKVFTPNGDSFDGMAERLFQYHYPVCEKGEYTVNAILEAINKALHAKTYNLPPVVAITNSYAGYIEEPEYYQCQDSALDMIGTPVAAGLDDDDYFQSLTTPISAIKQIPKKQVMQQAWAIARSQALLDGGKAKAYLSTALKQAWAQAKSN